MKNIFALKFFWSVVLFLAVNFSSSQPLLNPKTQPQFVNALPIPSVINGRNGGTFTIGVSQFNQWLGLVDPVNHQRLNTTVWGYSGSYPGPTILAKKNVPLRFFWRNNLVDNNNSPLPHVLPIDRSIDWAFANDPNWASYGVPIVPHLHGGHTESASDGLPDAWFTPGFAKKGRDFIKGDIDPYYYENDQEAATIWYHDHASGVTRLNVYAGLAGYYLITDENEMKLQEANNLPAAPYDLGLAIQDRMFTSTGQLFYPSMPEKENDPDPSALPEMFGDFILVNGMAWPVLDVEPRQYRFRVLNGSDSRFYNMILSSGQQFTQIGSDQGLLPSPVTMDQLLIAPGERKDIVLDFSSPGLWGQTIIVRNNAKAPYPKGDTPDPQTTGRIMAFRVTKPLNVAFPRTTLPTSLRPAIAPLQTSLAPRKLILFEAEDEFDRIMPMLGTVDNGALGFRAPLTENPMLNSTEIWEIYNETVDAHPIHLHLVRMQLISRQKFNADVDEQNGKPSHIKLIGQPRYPGPDEQGWKDTWVMYPGEVTRVIATFDRPGSYVWHCHILSHEEHDMMRPFYVGPLPVDLTKNKSNISAPSGLEGSLQLKLMPNPFNNNFSVQFITTRPEKIDIKLYDDNGVLVRKVYSGNQPAGFQTFKVNANEFAQGIYLCEIILNDKRIVRKLVLQR